MADAPVYGATPEAVAYALMRDCLHASGKLEVGLAVGGMTEEEVLALYGRCLATVRGQINSPEVRSGRVPGNYAMR